jgi:putative membrane protein
MTLTQNFESGPGDRKERSRRRGLAQIIRPVRVDVGSEPDPRLTFANERTFLAWSRTGLALIGGGLAAAQALHFGRGGAHLLIAVPAIALGGLIGIASYLRWQDNDRAMRLGEALGDSPLPSILVLGIVALAIIIAVLLLLAAVTG